MKSHSDDRLCSKIVHFEIPVSDSEKMSRFYSELFGWKFEKQNMPGMDYWLIRTTESPNDLGGGMYHKMDENDKPRFYVQVEDVDAHTERLKLAGGTVLMEKAEIPGTGWSVLAKDPEGNTLGLFQPMTQTRAIQARGSKRTARKKRSAARRKKARGRR